MTLRELLKELQALDTKLLNNPVLVSPHSGGYNGISHIEVMFVGNVVLHLLEAPKLIETGKQFEKILTRER